jgi:Tol biopolymer transport system component
VIAKVSTASTGLGGDGPSTLPSVSGNGALVAFVSEATNLLPTVQTGSHAYVKDVATGAVRRVDPPGATRVVQRPLLAASGRSVVFVLQSAVGLAITRVYARNLVTNALTLISQSTAGVPSDTAEAPAVSGSGRDVAFRSFDALVETADGVGHLYVRDQALKTTVLVDRLSTGETAAGAVGDPAISSDGRLVAFSDT